MRWLWIDRFLEFESGRRAVTVKNVSLAEEQVYAGVTGYPMMPATLIIEGLAQTGGLLVGQLSDFRERVVLAKVSSAKFHDCAFPGESLTYTATMERAQAQGAMVKGTSHVGDRLQAEIELVFAQLDERFAGVDQFEPAGLLRLLRVLGLFDVGRCEDGSPIKIPEYMLAAEREELGTGS